MASGKFTISGLTALRNDLRGMARRVRAAVPGAVMKGLDVILDEARGRAPVDTGELASTLEETKPRSFKGITKAQVKTTARYGPAVEYGAEGRIGDDFMQRTYDEMKYRAADVTVDALLRGIG